MYYETSALDWRQTYKLLSSTIVPRPIAWIVTTNEDGTPNAAPFSFFNYFSGFPPVVCIGMTDRPTGPPDTFLNLQRTGEFVINLVPEELAEAMNVTAIEFPPGVNEIEAARLRTVQSRIVQPPRIEGCPVALECRLAQVLDVLGDKARIVVAHVLAIHVEDGALIDADRCYVDTSKLKLVGRMESPGCYVHTTDRFTMRTPTMDEWCAQADIQAVQPACPQSSKKTFE